MNPTSQALLENLDPYLVFDSVKHPERRKFDPWLTADDTEWINQIYRECFPLGKTKRHKETFEIAVLNLSVTPDPQSVFLDKRHYKKLSRPPKSFAPTTISPIFRELESKFYVDIARGYRHSKSNAVSSTVQSTEKLLSLVPDGLHYTIHRDGLVRYKKPLDTPDPLPEQDQWAEDVLLRYNKETEPENQLYRTRKDSLEYDGRFTGAKTQRLSKEDRRSLKMDGDETFEVDVSNCIPSLLYAEKLKIRCPGDAYDLPGIPRSLAKKALLIMLNTACRSTAVRAVQSSMSHPRQHKASEIIDALEKKHHAIRDFFYVNEGRRLMNLESHCMCGLLDDLLQRNVKVYPIYDSVIGRASERKIVEHAFRESFTVNDIEPHVH